MACLNELGPQLPELLGGSADLAPSNLTFWSGAEPIGADAPGGNYLHDGVREFGMGAIINGIAAHGGCIAYGATFLIFMEYMRNAVRMAALMGHRAIYVFTHDSISLGEDGPTHQPVEQLASMRSTPNLSTWRPCDAVETAAAWDAALAMDAADELGQDGRAVRVVSMPSTDIFDAQDATYREGVLPAEVKARVAVEASHADYWYKYVGLEVRIIGMRTFGESGKAGDLFQHFGITVELRKAEAEQLLAKPSA